MRLGLHSSRRESLRGGGGVDGLEGGEWTEKEMDLMGWV